MSSGAQSNVPGFVSFAKVGGRKGTLALLFTDAELVELRMPERGRDKQATTMAASIALGVLGLYATTGDLRATLKTLASQPVEETLRQVPDHSAYAYNQIAKITFPKKDVLPVGDFWSGVGWRVRVKFTDDSLTEYDLGVVGRDTSKKLTALLKPILGERVEPVDKLPPLPLKPAEYAPAYATPSDDDKKYMKQCHSCQGWIPKASEFCPACNAKQ